MGAHKRLRLARRDFAKAVFAQAAECRRNRRKRLPAAIYLVDENADSVFRARLEEWLVRRHTSQ